jgi:hypothetical protein
MISETGIWSEEEAVPINYPHSELLCIRLYKVFSNLSWLYDFGCGDGYYLRNLWKMGFRKILGIDGLITPFHREDYFLRQDLSQPYSVNINGEILLRAIFGAEGGDLKNVYLNPGQVLSLEVGEHIPQQYEQIFIDNLCHNCNSRMVISWAIEGQGGIGHVNCRNNSYVINEIEKRGFEFNIDLTSYIRRDIEIGVSYFRNSLMVFDRV